MDFGLKENLFEQGSLAGIGADALRIRSDRHGKRAYWLRNVHLNYTNVCRGKCKVCRYSKTKDDPAAYTLSIDAICSRIAQATAAVEVHIVGGINPDLPYSYYMDLVRELRRTSANLFIKAFTASEIDWMCELSGKSTEAVLGELISSGLNALPGGGAEIFAERVRCDLFPGKITADRWLAIHETAHRLGISTTATMLFGHVETPAERMEHLYRLRDLQARTGGFAAFVPLPVVGYGGFAGVDGMDALRTLAISRIVLDNFAHIKVFWPIWGLKLAQLALSYGADDFDGTVGEYKIVDQSAQVGVDKLKELIAQAGFEPVERNGQYQVIA